MNAGYLQTRMNQLSPNLLLRREVKVGTLVFALLFTSDVLAIPERSYAFTDASTNLQMKEVLKNLDTEISRYTKVPEGQRKVLWHPLIPNPSVSLGAMIPFFIQSCGGDPPPLKWSDLRYVFDIKEDCNGKEAGA